ncbi:MAG TPA: glycosyltransferase, partial [Vicinamibacteria bacterium]|nr:glycosyltransferase [Vicinamibacteria bacterium]
MTGEPRPWKWAALLALFRLRLLVLPRQARASLLARRVWAYLPSPLRTIVRRLRESARAGATPFYERALAKIVAEEGRGREVFVFAPSIEWDLALFQRPQQMARALAREGALVFFAEPEHSKRPPGFQKIEERLYLAHVPIDVFRALESPFVFVLSWNKEHLNAFRSPRILYDYIDDLSVFPRDLTLLKQNHEALTQNATLVLATAKSLHREVTLLRPDSLLCQNAADYDHFQTARDRSATPPKDLLPLLERRLPIVGYFGALARWFDFDLLLEVATARPMLSFLLIGPDYDHTLPGHPLLRRPNVRWLGPRPYAEIPRYLRHFDVATIPFRLNKITHATSPLKLFEYMAGGVPVVITPMDESMGYDTVLVAKDAEEFARKIDDALVLRSDPRFLNRLDRVARENTWTHRAH